MTPTVTALYRYPVKGLTGESLETVSLEKGEGLAGDRMVAIAREAGLFDPASPVAIPKTNFLMLAKDEAMAKLRASFDLEADEIKITVDGETQLKVSLSTEDGQRALGEFLRTFLDKRDIYPQVAKSPGHKFTDISVVSPAKMRAISLINLASIRALEKETGYKIDPMRFRANVYFDSEDPFVENDWIDQAISIGGVKMQCVMRTKRCPATEVNPETGERDIRVPYELRKHFGHFDMGVYAEVQSTGNVQIGDTIAN